MPISLLILFYIISSSKSTALIELLNADIWISYLSKDGI